MLTEKEALNMMVQLLMKQGYKESNIWVGHNFGRFRPDITIVDSISRAPIAIIELFDSRRGGNYAKAKLQLEKYSKSLNSYGAQLKAIDISLFDEINFDTLPEEQKTMELVNSSLEENEKGDPISEQPDELEQKKENVAAHLISTEEKRNSITLGARLVKETMRYPDASEEAKKQVCPALPN